MSFNTEKPREQPLAQASEPDWKCCVSVVVPVYNEANHVDQLLRAVEASPVLKEIIVVDDGSTDGTRERLLTSPVTAGITLICHQRNQGKGAAIRTALSFARGEYLIIQDCDLEYDPQEYPALLGPLKETKTNAVYGVRSEDPERGRCFYLGARFLTLLTNLLFGSNLHDEATGYKAFRRELFSRITLECQGFDFCPEITAKLCRLGETISEVPISYKPRTRKEGKKIRLSDGAIAIWVLVRFRFVSRRRLGVISRTNDGPPFPLSLVHLPVRREIIRRPAVVAHSSERSTPLPLLGESTTPTLDGIKETLNEYELVAPKESGGCRNDTPGEERYARYEGAG